MITQIGDLLLVTGFTGALLFVAGYGARSAWWRNEAGRNVMAFMAVIMVLLGLAMVTVVFGLEFPARPWIRAGSFLLLNIVIWWRVGLLLRTQHRERVDR